MRFSGGVYSMFVAAPIVFWNFVLGSCFVVRILMNFLVY